MRKISFRAWDIKGEIMINYQVHGNQPYIKFNGDLVDTDREGDEIPIQGYELMQFTGLLDKNDKEIYESDRVRYYSPENKPDIISEIQWDDERGCWVGMIGSSKDYEVIGNIYEN